MSVLTIVACIILIGSIGFAWQRRQSRARAARRQHIAQRRAEKVAAWQKMIEDNGSRRA